MTKQRKARATRKGRKRFVKLCYDKRKAIKWRKKTFPFQGEGLREGGGLVGSALHCLFQFLRLILSLQVGLTLKALGIFQQSKVPSFLGDKTASAFLFLLSVEKDNVGRSQRQT